ncbi:TPA: hypothetical protein ACPVW6_000953 [Vibrio parahaemolyticus]|uniref:hypothetical protein n=1 Tax=Vibrio parahaemolyticus TaxID=670 RepID=UPI001A8C118E|nr:hypothetical protein [Vibrio parahaemolyticus]EIN4363737.1 hypothetical protein [Vibrio parahaemolyticus]EKC5521599.1 hypothetical protein [Vibrio parahaemolyticus]MBO0178100.1 hypothetical protein [Vibrio parahaemolyticus]
MTNLVMEVVASITTSAAVTGGLIFFAKSYLSEKIKHSIGHEYALKLDAHKNELQRNASKELELLKAELKINELKHSIKLSSLQEKQASTVEVFHSQLLDLFDALNDYTTVFQARTGDEKEAKRLLVADKHDELKFTLRNKALYIPEALHSEIEMTRQAIHETAIGFMEDVEREYGAEMLTKWDDIHKKVNVDIQKTIKSLENEFRALLGAS